MSKATRIQRLQHFACVAVDKLVECDECSFADRHSAIQRVREHLEARVEQTGPWGDECGPQADENEDLL
jgi:hypothetical protein